MFDQPTPFSSDVGMLLVKARADHHEEIIAQHNLRVLIELQNGGALEPDAGRNAWAAAASAVRWLEPKQSSEPFRRRRLGHLEVHFGHQVSEPSGNGAEFTPVIDQNRDGARRAMLAVRRAMLAVEGIQHTARDQRRNLKAAGGRHGQQKLDCVAQVRGRKSE